MNEVEYPPYSVLDTQIVVDILSALHLIDTKTTLNTEVNKSSVESFFMLSKEVNALKSLKALLKTENLS